MVCFSGNTINQHSLGGSETAFTYLAKPLISISKIDELKQKEFNISYHQYNKMELYENIAESKVVIYPANTYETFCISALETQACKAVFVGRSLGAIKETLGYPCVCGIESNDFFEATKKVLEDQNYRSSFEQTGLLQARKYSWENVAKQFIEDFHQVANRSWLSRLFERN